MLFSIILGGFTTLQTSELFKIQFFPIQMTQLDYAA